jgi:hypothetical protein
MADIFELLVALHLSADVPPDELAELRWHLGLAELPAARPLTGHVEDADPAPVLAARGPGWKIPGTDLADLVERERGGWSLTARQEIHPDEFDVLRALLTGLARHAQVEGFAGYLRFYEDHDPQPILITAGALTLPAALTE